MAKGKGSKSTGYVSKGERRNVSRRTRNALRKDRRENLTLSNVVHALTKKSNTVYHNRASELFARYGSVATWAACVQAVKTEWVSQFHQKYGSLLKQDQ